MVLHGGFWWWGEYWGVFCVELPVYNGDHTSGSRLDPLLATVESVIVSGGAFVMAHTLGKTSLCNHLHLERGVCERKSPGDTKVSTEGGGGGAAGTGAEILLQPMVQTVVRQL